MLAEIAAANAAFAVIKTAIQNGREIADVAHKVGEYVNATEDLRKKGEKKKKNPFQSGDLEEFMHLEKLKQQEEQLKELMIWTGRPGLWMDWVKFQADARKKRQAAELARRKRIKKIVDIALITIAIVFLGFAVGGLVWWALYLKGMKSGG